MEKKLYEGNISLAIRDLVSELKIAYELERFGEFIPFVIQAIRDEIGYEALEETKFYIDRMLG